MKFGIDRLIADPELRKALIGKRVALLGAGGAARCRSDRTAAPIPMSPTRTSLHRFDPETGERRELHLMP